MIDTDGCHRVLLLVGVEVYHPKRVLAEDDFNVSEHSWALSHSDCGPLFLQ
jgi:hypothetical protein